MGTVRGACFNSAMADKLENPWLGCCCGAAAGTPQSQYVNIIASPSPLQAHTLDLSGNLLTGPAFPPAWLEAGSLPHLEHLALSGNANLTGALPATRPWTQLQTLWVPLLANVWYGCRRHHLHAVFQWRAWHDDTQALLLAGWLADGCTAGGWRELVCMAASQAAGAKTPTCTACKRHYRGFGTKPSGHATVFVVNV